MCPSNAAKQYELLGADKDSSETADPEAALIAQSKGEGIKFNHCGRKTGCRLMDGAAHEERTSAITKISRALAICLLFMLLEMVGGYFAGSLAVLADAAHLMSDLAGFAISLLALGAARWLATPKQTFGYFRLEVLGALVSVQIIWVMTGIILYEAFRRLYRGIHVVDGRLMFCVACAGLLLNFIMIFILGHTHDHMDVSNWQGHGHGLCKSPHDEHSRDHDYGRLDDAEDGQSQEPKSDCCHINHEHKHERHLQHNGHEKSSHSHLTEVELSRNNGTPVHGDCIAIHGHDQDNSDQSVGSTEKRVEVVSEEESDICAASHGGYLSEHNREQAFDDEIQQGLKSSRDLNINLRGAYLHALGDLIQNIGVLVTGLVIWVRPEWQFIDLLCSVIFSLVVLMTTVRMLKDILWVLMESPPRDLDVEMLNSGLLQISGISAVLDLHVWALTPGTNLLSCHVEIKPGAVGREVLHDATEYCYNLHQIKHVTIQIEEAS